MAFSDLLATLNTASSSAITALGNVVKARRYVAVFMIEGTLVGSEKLRHKIGLPMKLLATLPDSQIDAGTAAAASTTVTLTKLSGGTPTTVGTLVWAANGTVPTINVAADVSFAAGDILRFDAPATADAALADIACTLLGHLL